MLQPAQGSPDEILVHYLKAGHVGWGRLDLPEELPEMWATETDISTLHPKVGDLLICEGGEVGRATVIGKPLPPTAIVQNSLHLVRQSQSADVRYLRYALEHAALSGWLDILCNKATIAHLTGDKLRHLQIPFHAASEQTRIANFLDEQTAQIDALIAEKERLDGLLGAYRSSLISAAVTGRLDVETGAVVPTEGGATGHRKTDDTTVQTTRWPKVALKRVANSAETLFTDGDWIEAPYITLEGIRLVQTGNIGVGHYKEQGYRYVSEKTFEELNCTEVYAGDMLVCRLADPVGRACLAPDLGARMITSVDNCIVRPNLREWNIHYLNYSLSGDEYLQGLEAMARGGTRDRVSRSMLGDVQIAKPPLADQTRIANFLDDQTVRVDALRKHCREHITLLREYRSSLISAAVTGQLDIDNFKRGVA
jgi:type I restriction enzyme S subunit